MISVVEVYNDLLFLTNKSKRGTSGLSPGQFNRVVSLSTDSVFKEYYGLPQSFQPGRENGMAYEQSQAITDALRQQKLSPVILTPNSDGEIDYPEDYVHRSSAGWWVYKNDGKGSNTKKWVPFEIVSDHEFNERKSDPVAPWTVYYPGMCFYKEFIKIEPASTNDVHLSYIKYPERPNMVYSVDSNDNVVPNSAASTDIDLPQDLRLDLIHKALSYLGIQMNSKELVQYFEAKTAKGA